MRKTTAIRIGAIVVFLAGAAMLISGCLDAARSVVAVYDAGRDEYRFLAVAEHIHSSQSGDGAAADFAWLRALYANRDHLILSPLFAEMAGGSSEAYLRVSKSQYSAVQLGGASGRLSVEQTRIPLDQIVIEPGEFFRPAPDDLCYYQQIVVPGKAADATLEMMVHWLSGTRPDEPSAEIDAELKRRAQGGAVPTWDDFTRSAVDSMSGKNKDSDNQNGTVPLPLENQSLVMLRDALVNEKVPLRRDGSSIYVVIAMTAKDVNGLNTFAEQFRAAQKKSWDDLLKDVPLAMRNKMLRYRGIFFDSLHSSIDDATHFRITLDFIDFLNKSGDWTRENGDELTKEDLKARATSIADAMAKEPGVDNGLTVAKVIEDFKANTLKAYPSIDPVEPGEGLNQAQANQTPSSRP
jgi:hypothetical protein